MVSTSVDDDYTITYRAVSRNNLVALNR